MNAVSEPRLAIPNYLTASRVFKAVLLLRAIYVLVLIGLGMFIADGGILIGLVLVLLGLAFAELAGIFRQEER